MAANPSVKSVRTDQQARLTVSIGALVIEEGKVEVALRTATADERSTSDALTTKLAEASTLHQQLVAATMPAEQRAIAALVEANLAEQRRLRTRLVEKRDALATSTRLLGQVKASLVKARGDLAATETELALAGQDETVADGWRVSVDGPLELVIADAASVATRAAATAAERKLGTLLGGAANRDVFLALVRSRYDEAVARAADAGDAVARAEVASTAVWRSIEPQQADVAATATIYAEVRALVQRAVDHDQAELAAAKAVLVELDEFELTGSVAADVAASAAAAVALNAPALEAAVRIAGAERIAADVELERLTLAKRALDPAYDPGTDADAAVTIAVAAASKAKKDHEDAEAALTAQMRTALDTWELDLPPKLVELTVETLGALATMVRIAATDGNELETDLEDAEEAYAAALDTLLRTQERRQAAALQVSARMDALEVFEEGTDERVLAVVRGDR